MITVTVLGYHINSTVGKPLRFAESRKDCEKFGTPLLFPNCDMYKAKGQNMVKFIGTV
jgi:hypothetical protein